jgi:F420-dependent oxidoreductase-like protein
MRFGLRNTCFIYPHKDGNVWQNLQAHARQAERDGFDSFWLMDHFLQLPLHGPMDEPFLDAWTTLPALAAVTSRIRLGVMVSPVAYRNPALLAKMVATMDVISHGRLNFGCGGGGYKPEYRQYGYEFDDRAAIRLEQMAEALHLMKTMWKEPRATFHGKYFHVENAILEPKPVQKPHPPILIGGVGPKITMRIIAEQGDACNLWGPPDEFAREREILKRHCDAVGRNEATIEKTTYDLVICAPTEAQVNEKIARLLPNGHEPWMSLVGTPAQLVDTVGKFKEVGAEHLCVDLARNDPESYSLFVEEVMSHFRGKNDT